MNTTYIDSIPSEIIEKNKATVKKVPLNKRRN